MSKIYILEGIEPDDGYFSLIAFTDAGEAYDAKQLCDEHLIKQPKLDDYVDVQEYYLALKEWSDIAPYELYSSYYVQEVELHEPAVA